MKRYLIFILIFSILIFSCYQAPETSTGNITLNLYTSAAKDALPGYDGELRLAVFSGGILDSIIDDSGSEIRYLTELPDPLLANNAVPINGREGVVSLLNVPAGVQLNLLVEYDGPYYDGGGDYYHSFSGVSETFEVKGGESEEIAVTLIETAYGSVKVNKGTLSSGYFRIFNSDDYDSFITISGSEIKQLNTSTTIIESHYGTVSGSYIISNEAILPGRKFRLIVSQNSTIDNWSYPDVGISGTFELQPGLTKSVTVTYYTYNNNDCISYC